MNPNHKQYLQLSIFNFPLGHSMVRKKESLVPIIYYQSFQERVSWLMTSEKVVSGDL